MGLCKSSVRCSSLCKCEGGDMIKNYHWFAKRLLYIYTISFIPIMVMRWFIFMCEWVLLSTPHVIVCGYPLGNWYIWTSSLLGCFGMPYILSMLLVYIKLISIIALLHTLYLYITQINISGSWWLPLHVILNFRSIP